MTDSRDYATENATLRAALAEAEREIVRLRREALGLRRKLDDRPRRRERVFTD